PPPSGRGAQYLNDDGIPDPTPPVHTWVTARMLHVYSLGHLAGIPGCTALAEAALEGLVGPLLDDTHGEWFASAGPGSQRDETKAVSALAFVVFGTSSATSASLSGAAALLTEALDPRWRDRAARITDTLLDWSAANEWRVPEHFDAWGTPFRSTTRDQPNHPFEPFGATDGRGLECSRLLLHVDAASGSSLAPGHRVEGAAALFHRAVTDGWAVDGADGYVYTTDWFGKPVVRQRLHWVVAEAISTAAALATTTGEPGYEQWYRTWWDYAARYLVTADGSWHHELDPSNRPVATMWPGRPDLYQSIHAATLPRLPLSHGADDDRQRLLQ
ncbi:MAG: AGE family epimerase/isomerase, partial [Terracoccus sp.]